tara:strand:+ start:3989 stop:4555 length:567 start_codon:yes stop_codon:yes gene_type:complete
MQRIAFDLDEVLCPMLPALSLHYSNVYRTKVPSNLPSVYNYSSYFGISPLQSKKLVKSFYSSSFCRDMKPLPHSVQAVRSLKHKYSLGIVTGRQCYAKNATHSFLNNHFYDLFDFVVCTNSFSLHGSEMSKREACDIYDIDLLIDDSIDNCKNVNCDSILFGNYPWNYDNNSLHRIHDWADFSPSDLL